MAGTPGVPRTWEALFSHALTLVFQQLDQCYGPLKQQFDAVDALNFHPTFGQACHTLKTTLAAMLASPAL